MLIPLLLLLLVIHVVFRNGLISGCLSLILTPIIAVLGFNVLITVLHWLA